MDDDDEPLTPEQAAIYCAVHGYELWRDRTDPQQPWGVARDDWKYWYWIGGPGLTPARLRNVIHESDEEGPGQLDPNFRKMISDGKLIQIAVPELPPTPQPAKS